MLEKIIKYKYTETILFWTILSLLTLLATGFVGFFIYGVVQFIK